MDSSSAVVQLQDQLAALDLLVLDQVRELAQLMEEIIPQPHLASKVTQLYQMTLLQGIPRLL